MLESLFVTPAATAIEEALASARATDGPIAVVGNARLAKALAGKRDVTAVDLAPRAAKKLAGKSAALADLGDRSFIAVVGVDASDASLTDWSRLVRDGGVLVTLDAKSAAANAARRALCGGLTELEQRHAGRLVITSGLVTHL